jgi:acetyl-CoA carboxylase alpha subunit
MTAPSAKKPAAWDVVQLARNPGRPTFRDYAARMCDEFIELHGDRVVADDPAIVGGFARIGSVRFLLLGHQKGSTTEERIACRFGMANPDGYRKALPDESAWASRCQDCEVCLSKCPQQIRIPNQMARIVETLRRSRP